MSEFLAFLTIGILVALAIYSILETLEILRASRDMPRVSVSGPQALVGCKAKVHSHFEPAQEFGGLFGRVLINGELWNADLDRTMDEVPEIGAELVVVAVDPSKLKVSVK